MKRKDVKRLLKDNPAFEAWVLEDSSRHRAVRNNPATAQELFKRWNDKKKGIIDLDNISQKTKRASEMLTGVQTIVDMMAEYKNGNKK